MTLTTDPRKVTKGRVEISATSEAKREALIGRLAEYRTAEGEILVGRIESLDCVWAVIRFDDGRWARSARIVRLVG